MSKAYVDSNLLVINRNLAVNIQIQIQFLTVMSNEYILEPLDPLEISFSKDKCNCTGTPKPSPTGKQNLLPNTATPGGSNSKDYQNIRHHSLSKNPPLPDPRTNLRLTYTYADRRYADAWSPTSPSPRRIKGYTSSRKRRQPMASMSSMAPAYYPNPQSIRRALDYNIRGAHEKQMTHLDDMLRRINMQLENSAKCLERFSHNNRRGI